MSQAVLHSPIGPIQIDAGDGLLGHLAIGAASPDSPEQPDPLLAEAMSQLRAWFAGALTAFDLPLAPPTSPRGQAHRDAIAGIDYGETASYGELARRIDSSPRAIGQACRRNPFPIIIPCHRVLGAGGTIGHYSAGEGAATKRWLLDLERRWRDRRSAA